MYLERRAVFIYKTANSSPSVTIFRYGSQHFLWGRKDDVPGTLSDGRKQRMGQFGVNIDLEQSLNRHVPGSWMAFGEGTRVCVGQRFALVEAKITLAKLFRK